MSNSTTQLHKPLLVPLPTAFAMLGIGRTKGFDLIKQGKIKTVVVGKRQQAVVKSLEAIAAGEVA